MSVALEPCEPQAAAAAQAHAVSEPLGSAGQGFAPVSSSPGGATLQASAQAAAQGFLETFQSLVYVIVIALFVITFIAQPFRIPSESMVPTLLVGDFLLVDKQVGPEPAASPFAPANQIHRGDLIVFHYPVEPALHLVKRVVGLPGDRLHLRNGRVVVNGQALAEPYAIFEPAAVDSFRDEFPRFTAADPGVDSRWWIEMRSLVHNGDLTIPAGHYFVLGDNRNDSEDSRYWGLVPESAIVGKPFLVYFSLNHPTAIPGQSFAAALPEAASAHVPSGGAHTESGFSRWGRVFHVIR